MAPLVFPFFVQNGVRLCRMIGLVVPQGGGGALVGNGFRSAGASWSFASQNDLIGGSASCGGGLVHYGSLQ